MSTHTNSRIGLKKIAHRWGGRLSLVVALASLVLLGGCNVDGMWGGSQAHATDDYSREELLAPPASSHTFDLNVANAREADLVEAVVQNRNEYHAALHRLRAYYAREGDGTKLTWADAEIAGLQKVQPFRYILEAEVAERDLRPTESIPGANSMFEHGRSLMREGGGNVPVFFRQDKMVAAARTFRELIQRYPTSDKIDDAAFYLGEIHKEYFKDQEPIAVRWYERAIEWNPQIPHPARFQAAVVYDFRLHDRDRALELYRQVVERETQDRTNVDFATRRIGQLSQDLSARSASRS